MKQGPTHLLDYTPCSPFDEDAVIYSFGACANRACKTRVTKDPKLVTCKSCLRTNRYKKAIQ